MIKYDIDIFEKDTETFVESRFLEGLTQKQVKEIFDLSSISETIFDYKISLHNAKSFEMEYNIRFDFSKYEYFLSPYEEKDV